MYTRRQTKIVLFGKIARLFTGKQTKSKIFNRPFKYLTQQKRIRGLCRAVKLYT